MTIPQTPPADLAARSLGLRLRGVAVASPEKVAIATATETHTFADVARHVAQAAAALRRAGVGVGDRFAILSKNSATILELFFAASLAGAVMVPLNFRLAPAEIADIVDDSTATLLFVEDEWLPLLAEVSPDLRSQLTLVRVAEHEQTDEYRAWRGTDELIEPTHGPVTDTVVAQMYTTGTTGRPKGVMISEGNLFAMTSKLPGIFLLRDTSSYLALLPMFHISGGGTPVSVLCAGAKVVLSSGTSSTAILRDLTTHRITHVNLVPSLIALLLADPQTKQADLSSLEMLMYGAAPSSDTTVSEAMALLPTCWFLHGYGLTECCGGVSYMQPHRHGDVIEWQGSVGTASPGCEIRVVDPETLRDTPVDIPGEVWVRSPQNTIGYWRRPEETERLYGEPGWLRTGDIGVLNEHGVLFLKDRLKDMIISGGENVYSAEVENAVSSHPAVLEVAVFGVPDEKWGEAVKAVVTLRPGSSATPAEIIEHTRARLAHYKCPKTVEIVQELPKSGSGKILKRVLREALRP